ncbi:hypothetical protein Pmar_PMAR002018 [Perkinsus marinus ATCC 50983]|uniref:Uncharacterized protein n=2 Tax=Perkinsus marinus (strain ATCC 50983 / TXsc) TaxID=423536 RepID=C5LYG2_PERM5|nr:hypothetical protein Pmar_PMAR002018 [Perkinsus marinus ATCC 50983]EEQ98200.1 hypothetical protein Pmar_PMAR002018 [Perkinsus marinus ATCC 50983]|eukprot:XP_002765483.1 hypothetical protein Pmar_PMAR002018 [Perkinsus marinus ATCC 50983]
MFAPWSNSFLSDVWGERRVWKYFKIGFIAGTWQLFWLGIIPAFTPYWPLPWMPIIGCLTLLAIVGIIYQNLPKDKRSLGSRKRIAMVLVSIGSCVAVFGISYPLLYYTALQLDGFLKFWIFLSFYLFRIVFEKVAKYYARLYCVDCYPMIVLFAMYAYEFFISSVISAVSEIWLAMLMIALDLTENLYYLYCSYQAINQVSLNEVVDICLPTTGDPAGSLRLGGTAEKSNDSDPKSSTLVIPKRPSDSSTGAKTADENSDGQFLKLGVYSCQLSDHSEHTGICADVVERPPSISGHLRLPEQDGVDVPEHDCPMRDRDRAQYTAADHLATGECGAVVDRDLERIMSPPRARPSSLLVPQGLVVADPGRRSIPSHRNSVSSDAADIIDGQARGRRGSNVSSRRSSVFEILGDMLTGVNMETMADMKDGASGCTLSIMTVAICKEVVEILAPIQYLICSLLLRYSNPKLHDTFWNMTDEEFMRGIRRLLIDIVAEGSLFVLLIIVMKRWLNESVVFIALRLSYQFFWPFLAMQICLMTHYIDLQYSNAGMTFSFDFKWIGEKNATWHGGNCYTMGNETVGMVCQDVMR